jgi:hypothetical protein
MRKISVVEQKEKQQNIKIVKWQKTWTEKINRIETFFLLFAITM